MYLVDSHMHSIVSRDSDAPRALMAQAAAELGVKEICFTDHYDIVDIDGSYNPTFDWCPAREEHRKAVEAYGDRVKIRYGLELGNVPADYACGERVQEEPGLDFVLCSVHNLTLEEGGVDFYDFNYTTPEICYAHLDSYFNTMYRSVQWGKFDILSHVPYPLRYMRDRDGQEVTLDRYEDQIHEILKLLVEQGKGVEINTKAWNQRVRQDYYDVVKRYLALGGEIVTVGSDAHTPDAVGSHIVDAYDVLKSLGMKYVAVFEKRQPHFISLED